ncbi:hypothetical protein QJS66_16565 [Kocuria rhizophila]|nr:hypothetical protein QJS66_16565 [Kocuria rhizophila]
MTPSTRTRTGGRHGQPVLPAPRGAGYLLVSSGRRTVRGARPGARARQLRAGEPAFITPVTCGAIRVTLTAKITACNRAAGEVAWDARLQPTRRTRSWPPTTS